MHGCINLQIYAKANLVRCGGLQVKMEINGPKWLAVANAVRRMVGSIVYYALNIEH